MKLRVWWIPQVPMRPFYVEVNSIAEGVKVMDVLANYDLFQYENNVKGDYSNAGGIHMLDRDDNEDGPDGSWVDWCDEGTGCDCPREFLEWMSETSI